MIENQDGEIGDNPHSYKQSPSENYKKDDGKRYFVALDHNLKSVPYVAMGLIISKIVVMPFTFVEVGSQNYLRKMICFIIQTVIHSGFAHILRLTLQERPPSKKDKNMRTRLMLLGLVVLSLGQFVFSNHKGDDEVTGILESLLMTVINLFSGYLNSDLSYGFTLTVLNLVIQTVGSVAPRIEILSVIVHIIVFSILASNQNIENNDASESLSLQSSIIKLFEKNQTFELMCDNEISEQSCFTQRPSIFYKIERLEIKTPKKNFDEDDKLQYWINKVTGILNNLDGSASEHEDLSQNDNVQYYTNEIPIPSNLNEKLDQNHQKDPELIVKNIQKLFVDKNFTRLQKILDQFKEDCRQRFQNNLAVPQFLKKDLFMFEQKAVNLAMVAITNGHHMYVKYELYEKKKSPGPMKQVDLSFNEQNIQANIDKEQPSKLKDKEAKPSQIQKEQQEILKHKNKAKSQKLQDLEQMVINNRFNKKKKKQASQEQVEVSANARSDQQITSHIQLPGHVSPSYQVNKKVSNIFNNSLDILPKIIEVSSQGSISEPSPSGHYNSISSQESHSMSSLNSLTSGKQTSKLHEINQQANNDLIIVSSDSQQQISPQEVSPSQKQKSSKLNLQTLNQNLQSEEKQQPSRQLLSNKKKNSSPIDQKGRHQFSFGTLPFEREHLEKFNFRSKSISQRNSDVKLWEKSLQESIFKGFELKKSKSYDGVNNKQLQSTELQSKKQSDKDSTAKVKSQHKFIEISGEVGSKITASFQFMKGATLESQELEQSNLQAKFVHQSSNNTQQTQSNNVIPTMKEETSEEPESLENTSQSNDQLQEKILKDQTHDTRNSPTARILQDSKKESLSRQVYRGRVSQDDSQSISDASLYMKNDSKQISQKHQNMYVTNFKKQNLLTRAQKMQSFKKSKSTIPVEQKHSQNVKIIKSFSKISNLVYRSQYIDTGAPNKGSFDILENDGSPGQQKKQNMIKESELKLKQYQLEHFKEKCKKLEKRVENNKIFLNMVIHDLRSPTTQVQFLVSQQIQNLKQIREQMKKALQKRNSSQSWPIDRKESKQKVQPPIQKKEEAIVQPPVQEKEPQIQILDQEPQIKEQKQLDSSYVKESKMDDAIDISQESMGIPDEDHHVQDMKNCVNSNNLNNLQQPILEFSQVEAARITITSAERALNEEINKLYEEKNELLQKLEKQEETSILNQIQSIRENLDDIDKNKGVFYSKIANKKFEHLKKKSLNELLHRDQQDFKMQNDDEEPQICSTHLSKDQGMIKYNRPFINQIDQYYQRLDLIQKKIDDIYRQQEEKQQQAAWENYKKELKFKPEVGKGEYYNQNDFKKLFVQGTLNVQCQTDEVFPDSICKTGKSPERNYLSIQTSVFTDEIQGVSPGPAVSKGQNQNGIIFEDMKKIDSAINSLENCGYCSTMLLTLINDLLDLAKLQKMTFELNNQFFDITNTIKNAFGTLEYFANQKQIKPQFIIQKDIEPYFKNLYGDDGRFTQIFLNFLSNAFKFTPSQGNISIEIKSIENEAFCKKISNKNNIESVGNMQKSKTIVRRKNSSQSQLVNQSPNNLLNDKVPSSSVKIFKENPQDSDVYFIAFEIRIKDSGKGISKENQSKLFLNFSKLADEEGLNKQGTGLGLSICKQLIDRMGGEVRIESDNGQPGTCFVITLRAYSRIKKMETIAEVQRQCTKESIGWSKAKNKVMKLIKEQKNALKYAKSDKNLKRIASVVLNDRRSIGRNVWCSNLQNQQSNDKDSGLLNDKKSSNAELKGINIDQIDSMSNQEKRLKLHLNQMKVLVVNDEFFILSFLKQMVEQVEIRHVDTAENGFDAYNKVLEQNYDFILCDLEMPVMNGYICAQKIKAKYDQSEESLFYAEDMNNQKCPLLVACSALVTTEIQKKALAHGFDMAVQSPLTNRILEDEILKEVIGRKGRLKHEIRKEYPSNNSLLSSESDILIAQDQEDLEISPVRINTNAIIDNFSFQIDAQSIQNKSQDISELQTIKSSDVNISESPSVRASLGLASLLRNKQSDTKNMNDIQ